MQDNVIREFKRVGKYRVRLLHPRDNPEAVVLDVREYVETHEFQRFTRRGIHIRSLGDAVTLAAILQEAKDEWARL